MTVWRCSSPNPAKKYPNLSDNRVIIYDKYGELLRSGNYGFGGVKTAVTGSNTVCIITDNGIEEVVINKG